MGHTCEGSSRHGLAGPGSTLVRLGQGACGRLGCMACHCCAGGRRCWPLGARDKAGGTRVGAVRAFACVLLSACLQFVHACVRAKLSGLLSSCCPSAPLTRRFLRLPSWVRVLVTGRPQVQDAFQRWQPSWIKPEEEQNRRDMQARACLGVLSIA